MAKKPLPPPSQLTLNLYPTALPEGVVNTQYYQVVTMTASEGTSPYTYSCTISPESGISVSTNPKRQLIVLHVRLVEYQQSLVHTL